MIRRLLPASTYSWSTVRPDFTGANFLLYLGAFVTLAASYGLLDTFEASEAFFVASVEIVLLLALAAAMYYARRPISAGLLSFVVAALVAVWAAAFFEWIGWWPAAPAELFHVTFHGPYLLVELVVIAVSVALLFATRFPLVGLVTAVALWYLLADNGAALFDSLDGDKQAGLAFASGLVLMGAAALLDDTPLRPPSFWLHLVGLASFYAGLFQLWSDTDWGWAGIAVVSAFALIISAALDRSAYAVFGGLGLLAAAGHFIDDLVGDLLGFSLAGLARGDEWRPWLAYAAVGLILMLLGMLLALGEKQGWRHFFVRIRSAPGDDILAAEDPLSRPATAEPVQGLVEVETTRVDDDLEVPPRP
jgi:hypothetical protein